MWDIDDAREVWSSEDTDELPGVDVWRTSETFVLPLFGSAVFRITGLFANHAKLEHADLRITADAIYDRDVHEGELTIASVQTNDVLQKLRYRDFSGDWAFPTFADEGNTISVLTPYDVTFFRTVD